MSLHSSLSNEDYNAIHLQANGRLGGSTMDDLLALFDAAPEEPEDFTHESDGARRASNVDQHDEDSEQRRVVNDLQQRQAASADAKIGLRMINRILSGADLLELLVEHPYHSPAALCAMSLNQLRSLLIDPSPTTAVDYSSSTAPCGKTHLITVGLVFSNSGTKISASGNAFCVLTLGNLASGPALTCMLFGSAYSQNCRRCQPGKVVALLGPRLLPPKESSSSRNDATNHNNNNTAVSFSVNDERHIVLVADALDYGTCPAPVRGKNNVGHWVHDAKRCGHYVDKRMGEYCPKHQKLAIPGRRATSGMGGKAAGPTTAMQKLRQEATLFPKLDNTTQRFSIPGNRVSGGAVMSNSCVPLQQQVSSGPPLPRSQQMMAQLQSQLASGSIDTRVTTTSLPMRISGSLSNRLLHPNTNTSATSGSSIGVVAAARPFQQKAHPMPPSTHLPSPLHTTAAASSNPSTAWRSSIPRTSDPRRLQNTILNPIARDFLFSNPSKNSVINPYGKASTSVVPTPSHRATETPSSDWMQPESNKRKPPSASRGLVDPTNSKKRRPVQNTDTTHFSGSVPIPQPKLLRLLDPRRPTTDAALVASAHPHSLAESQEQQQRDRRAQEVLGRQSAVAAKLRTCNGGGSDVGGVTKATAAPAASRTSIPVRPNHPFLMKAGRKVAPPQPKPRSTAGGDKNSENQNDRTQNNTLFGPLSDQDRESIRSAKSMFADEAAAEEYAYKRNQLLELERNEEAAAKGRMKNNASVAANDTLIRKEWFCRKCNRTYKTAPRTCQKANHPVVVRRSIQESTNLDERRQALSDLQADDGGLKLGAGLEWSKWNRFR